MQAQQSQQAMQYHNQQNAQLQQRMLAQQQQMMLHQLLMRRRASPQQLEKTQALQQQREQQAIEQQASFVQEQQRKQAASPAQDEQQAQAQQKEAEKQLNLLAVKNYQEVFLPGQVFKALQARTLSHKAESELNAINSDLLSNSWWSKQEATQLNEKVAAYGKSLTMLTVDLLGFDLDAPLPSPAPLSTSQLDGMLANNTFDPLVATKIIRDAAQAEKLIAGERLAKAVKDFNTLTATAPESQELPAALKQRRNEIKEGLRLVNKEIQRYNVQIGTLNRIRFAHKEIQKATAGYLAKNGS
ncbi:hypothetical protein [Hymenobacter saemangeumensis]